MYLTHLQVRGYRNYQDAQLELHPSINIFLGANGQGKTNLLEAIYYLAMGRTFRGNKESELLGWGADYFRLSATYRIEESNRARQLEIYYDPQKRKRIQRNGVRYARLSDIEDRLLTVLFTPDDLLIIKGSPGMRRAFVDRELDALEDGYYELRLAYQRVLQQRNELLKDVRARRQSAEYLLPWNVQLAELGTRMIRKRLDFLRELVPRARRMHAYLVDAEKQFDVRYHASLGQVLHAPAEALQERFLTLMQSHQKEEIRRGVSLYGPHRDDLLFYEDGRELRTFGSQGQQRTAILVMKMAEIGCFHKRFGRQPLLLLDDVMSELDRSRQTQLMNIILKDNIQTIITGTNADFYTADFGYNPVFKIEQGKIIQNKNSL